MARRVLIVGAGIAGLAAGAALGQAGHTVEIVEARSGPEPEGVGLCLPGNALRALRTLNALDAVAAAGFAYDHNIFCDSDGTAVATVPCRIARQDTPVTVGIRRADLHAILLAGAQQAGAQITYGSKVRAIDNAGSTARVRFYGGRTGSYDLVLGCDGVHSALRRYVSPESRAIFAYAAAWRVTAPRHESITAGTLYCRPDGRAGLIPLDADTMYFFAIARATRKRPDPGTLHTQLAGILGGYGGLFPGLVDRLGPSDPIVYSPIEDVSIRGSWHRGRVLLMGDAAHATTPYLTQGAGMALEDAVVLAAVLATGRPVKECLDAFMRHRLERCRFVQETSRRLLNAELADRTADRDTVLGRIKRMPENFEKTDAILDRSPLDPFPFAKTSGSSHL